MSRAKLPFRESDIIRAVKGAEKAGLLIAGVSCHPDGTIEVHHGKPMDTSMPHPSFSIDDAIDRLKKTAARGKVRRAREVR